MLCTSADSHVGVCLEMFGSDLPYRFARVDLGAHSDFKMGSLGKWWRFYRVLADPRKADFL